MSLQADERIVMTLDAGGTNFAFSAVQAGKVLGEPVALPAMPRDLKESLSNIVAGFEQVLQALPQTPAAISFAFPGPADYTLGIIDNRGNLPAYSGGVALGPMLEDRFGLPVFINNDGDLFAYGEAIAGTLPQVNQWLASSGSQKRYENLIGVTLGTGLGGGIVSQERLIRGDNSAAGEVWLLRNKKHPGCFAEEGASIRAVQQSYLEVAGTDIDAAPTPQEIFEIGMGRAEGDQTAARQAFETLGEVVGDVVATLVTLLDGIVVIGGGLAGAAELFMPRLIRELNGQIRKYSGELTPRVVQEAFNLDDEAGRQAFLANTKVRLPVPHSYREVDYDPHKRIGVAISRLGANQAVALGAYAFALQQLDQ